MSLIRFESTFPFITVIIVSKSCGLFTACDVGFVVIVVFVSDGNTDVCVFFSNGDDLIIGNDNGNADDLIIGNDNGNGDDLVIGSVGSLIQWLDFPKIFISSPWRELISSVERTL